MTSRFPLADITMFSAMQVIKPSDQEKILSARMATFVDLWKKYDPPMGVVYDVANLEFDTDKIIQETDTVYQATVENRVNQVARSVTTAFATGADLDAIASRYPGGVPRLSTERYDKDTPIPERRRRDDRFRTRLWLAPNLLAAGGTKESYEFMALTALPEARDASATRVRTEYTAQSVITLMMDREDPRPTLAEKQQVRRYILREENTGLTDDHIVQGCGLIDLDIEVQVFCYPWAVYEDVRKAIMTNVWGSGDIVDAAGNDISIVGLFNEKRFLGADLSMDELRGAMDVPGAHSTIITRGPKVDVVEADPTQTIRITGFDLDFGGFKQ